MEERKSRNPSGGRAKQAGKAILAAVLGSLLGIVLNAREPLASLWEAAEARGLGILEIGLPAFLASLCVSLALWPRKRNGPEGRDGRK